jgi:hypothetical protein
MKQLLLCAILFLLSISFLFADVCWNQPVTLVNYDNVFYSGEGLKTSDDCVLISWQDSSGDIDKRYVQKFSPQMVPQWAIAPELPAGGVVSGMVETSDGNYIIMYSDWKINCYKINQAGEHVWNSSTGVPFFDSSNIQSSKLIADNNGGAFCIGGYYNDHCLIQHIHSDGTLYFQSSGYTIEDSYGWNCNAYFLNDNSTIISFRQTTQDVIKRLDQSGQVIWEKYVPFPITDSSFKSGSLVNIDNTYLFLFAQFDHQVIASKFDMNGNVIWENNIVVDNNTTGNIDHINYSRIGQNFIILWRTYNSIRAQKIDFTGQMLWQNEGVSIAPAPTEINLNLNNQFSATYDNNDGVYIFYDYWFSPYTGFKGTGVQHFTAEGEVWSQTIPITTQNIPMNNTINSFQALLNNRLVVYWYENRGLQSGIYCQSIDIYGNILFQASGLQIKTGSRGCVANQVVAALPNKCIVFWQDFNGYYNDDFGPYSRIKYQILNGNSTQLLPAGGQPLNTDGDKEIKDLKIMSLPGNQVLVYWLEHNYQPGNYTIKAQLLDSDANQLWEPNGKIICQSSSLINEFLANYYNSSLYFLWTSGDYTNNPFRIYGQRLLEGSPQWDVSGLLLASTNPSSPTFAYGRIRMVDNCICWESYFHDPDYSIGKAAYYLKIDDNGQPLAGFETFGNRIAEYASEYSLQRLDNILSIPDGLAFIFSNITVTQLPAGATQYEGSYFMQTVNNAGVPQWGEFGTNWDFSTVSIATDSHFYSISSNPIQISKINLDLTIDSTWNVGMQNGSCYSKKIFKLSNNRYLVTGIYYSSPDYHDYIAHFYFDEDANNIIPASFLITPVNNQYHYSPTYEIDVNNDNGYVLWANSNVENNPYLASTRLFVQKINNGDVGSEDQAITPTALITMHTNYPNPFNDQTTISFELKNSLKCDVSVYNTKGQFVKTIQKGLLPKGENKLIWDGKDDIGNSTANGIYFYRVSDGKHTYTKKMIKVN